MTWKRLTNLNFECIQSVDSFRSRNAANTRPYFGYKERLSTEAFTQILYKILLQIFIAGDSTSAESEVKYVPAEWRGLSKTAINGSIQQAVLKASDYLLNEVNLINNKGASIFRAVVGLSFAETIRPLNESQKELLKKQLNIETALDLMQ